MGSISENGLSSLSLEGNPERYLKSGISVLIVGAGIGGLTCALECWRKGHQVQVLERSKTDNLLGDSLTVGPSAINILRQHWPALIKDFEADSYHPLMVFYKYDGEKIFGPAPFEWNPGATQDDPDAPKEIDRHSRPALHQALKKQIERCGIVIEYNKRAADYYEDIESAKGGVVFEDGERREADIVVAADGVHTKSWKLVAGEKPAARASGKSVYRTAFPVGHMLKDPVLTEHFALLDGRCSPINLLMGGGGHGVMWRTDKVFGWGFTHKDTGSADESWSNRVSPSDALALLEGTEWSDIFRRAIACTPPDSLIDWKLMFRDPQPQWASPGGFVIQLGDSAHTFLPSSGNGATQAMEDGASLAACLQLAGRSAVPLATKIHAKLRFERVTCLQLFGFVNQFSQQKPDWEKVGKDPKLIRPRFGKWVWKHDPEKYAEQSWEPLRRLVEEGREVEWKSSNVPPGYTYKPWTLDDMLALEKEGKVAELEGEWY